MITWQQWLGLFCVLVIALICVRLGKNTPLGWVFIGYGAMAILGVLGLNYIIGYFWPPGCTMRESIFLGELIGCASTAAGAGWGLIAGGAIVLLHKKRHGK